MSCPSCDAVRFPPKQHSENTGRTVVATTTVPTSRKKYTDTVKVNNESVRGQRLDNSHMDMDTITKQKLDDDSVGCPCCLNLITADTDCIKCDSCLNINVSSGMY